MFLNKNPKNSDSVWHTGKLLGKIDELNPKDQGYAYTRIRYQANPLGEKQVFGLPGEEFSISGPYAKHYNQNSDIDSLNDQFPRNLGYYWKAENFRDGNIQAEIFDINNNRIAYPSASVLSENPYNGLLGSRGESHESFSAESLSPAAEIWDIKIALVENGISCPGKRIRSTSNSTEFSTTTTDICLYESAHSTETSSGRPCNSTAI